ncbi:MAG: DUF1015 domain-containing protein [bacterium]
MEPSRLPPLMQSFHALRYADTGAMGRLIAPPYDVIDGEMRGQLAEEERNIVHLTLGGNPDPYEAGARVLEEWVAEGVLVRDGRPTVTVMRQRFDLEDRPAVERTGIFVSVAAEPYGTGRVRPHERTRPGPKEDRLELLRATGTVTEPVFLLSPDPDGGLAGLMGSVTARSPDAAAEQGGVGIEVWFEPGEGVEEVLASAASAPLYIADGHHRYETTAAWGVERGSGARVLAFVVPTGDPGLVVLPAHRVIRGRPVDQEALLRSVAPRFALETAEGAECTIVWPGRVETHLGCLDPVGEMPGSEEEREAAAGLTITRVERYLVRPLLSAAGPESFLEHTPDETRARIRVAEGSAAAAVIVDPTPVEDVLRVADEGGVMPPKSTYFYPKVPSGIVMLPGD